MTKPAPIVTRESLRTMLNNADDAMRAKIIGRALVQLFRRQTEAEKAADTTTDDNNIGFASCDSKGGSLTAKSFLKHGTLSDWQVERWTRIEARTGFPRICRYHRQLNEIALEQQRKRELLAQQQQMLEGV